MSTKQLSDLDFGTSAKVTGLPAPTAASDAATKGYIDNLVGLEATDDGASGDLTYDNPGDGYTALSAQGTSLLVFTSLAAIYVEGIAAPAAHEPTDLTLFAPDGTLYVYHEAGSALAADRMHLATFAGVGLIGAKSLRFRYSRVSSRWLLAAYPT